MHAEAPLNPAAADKLAATAPNAMLRQTTRQCRSALRACPSAVRRLATMPAESELRKTPLHAEHLALGAKMGPFGGWDMPIQYPDGIMKSHLFTRAKAGLFDVSHMLGVVVRGADRVAFMESLCTADIQAHSPRISCHATTPAHPRRGCCASHPARAPPSPDAVPPQALPDGSGTLSLLTNEAGGIIDDMIITNAARGPSEKRKRVGPHAKIAAG